MAIQRVKALDCFAGLAKIKAAIRQHAIHIEKDLHWWAGLNFLQKLKVTLFG